MDKVRPETQSEHTPVGVGYARCREPERGAATP